MILYNSAGKCSYETTSTNFVKIRNVSVDKETLESS